MRETLHVFPEVENEVENWSRRDKLCLSAQKEKKTRLNLQPEREAFASRDQWNDPTAKGQIVMTQVWLRPPALGGGH